MNKGLGIRMLPILGISLALLGFIYLTFQTYQLTERKAILKQEIKELETIKARLTQVTKEKDTIITIQSNIISQSSDTVTVAKGAALIEKIEAPGGNSFIITPKGKSNLEQAQQFEKEGFNYLLNKDVENAIISFRKSENAYNGFHQVYDIAVFLEKNKQPLTDKNSEIWQKAFTKIRKDFSWKMPKDIQLKIAEKEK